MNFSFLSILIIILLCTFLKKYFIIKNWVSMKKKYFELS